MLQLPYQSDTPVRQVIFVEEEFVQKHRKWKRKVPGAENKPTQIKDTQPALWRERRSETKGGEMEMDGGEGDWRDV